MGAGTAIEVRHTLVNTKASSTEGAEQFIHLDRAFLGRYTWKKDSFKFYSVAGRSAV